MSEGTNLHLLNGLALAYIGDAAYELGIRNHLLMKGQTKPNVLHQTATLYVSAKAQAYLVDKLVEENQLTDDEITYYKRGRNAKSHTKAKHADSKTYSQSTGFEALLGYLYVTKQKDRLEEVIRWCIDEIEKRNQ